MDLLCLPVVGQRDGDREEEVDGEKPQRPEHGPDVVHDATASVSRDVPS